MATSWGFQLFYAFFVFIDKINAFLIIWFILFCFFDKFILFVVFVLVFVSAFISWKLFGGREAEIVEIIDFASHLSHQNVRHSWLKSNEIL